MKFRIKENHADDYTFVLGNTRHLKDCSEKELEVLHGNGDPRISLNEQEDKAAPAKQKVIAAS